MKAQRRHELQQNELAKVIKGAPTFWQQSGGKLLAGLIAVLVLALLINFWTRSKRQAREQAVIGLSTARQLIDDLRGQAAFAAYAPAQDALLRRRQSFNEANTVLGDVMRLTEDRRLTSEALLARGDLNWAYAMLPEPEGASTQPVAPGTSRKEVLDAAADAYRAVADGYADNKAAYFAARFGLAAVAEERGEWDTAGKIYQAIVADAKDLPGYHDLASARMRILPQLREPVILAKPTTMPLLPPLVSAPASGPTTAAASAPAAAPTTTSAVAAATTAPATQPK